MVEGKLRRRWEWEATVAAERKQAVAAAAAAKAAAAKAAAGEGDGEVAGAAVEGPVHTARDGTTIESLQEPEKGMVKDALKKVRAELNGHSGDGIRTSTVWFVGGHERACFVFVFEPP